MWWIFCVSPPAALCKYTGGDMKTAHTDLNISEADWNGIKSVRYLVDTLDKFEVPEKEKAEGLSAISGLRGDIVER